MKKFTVVMLILAVISCVFVSCSKKAETTTTTTTASTPAQTTSTSSGTATQTKATPTEVVKLQVWYAMSGASGEAFLSQAQAFDAAHPEIELELTYSGSYSDTATKVSAALLTGNEPDFAVMGAGQLYTGGQGNFDMEELVKDPEFDINTIYPGMLEYGKFEGRISALPYGISTQVIFYNKNIIKAAGLDMENNPPKTWAEFLEVAKFAQKNGNINKADDFYGFDTSDSVWLFKSMLGQVGNPVVEKQGNEVVPVFNNASGVKAGEFWKSMVDAGIMPAGQHDNAEKKFLAGNLAFVAASSNRTARWAGNTSFELGAIVMPSFEKKSLALGGNVIVILTRDKKKSAAAWELTKYLVDEPNQTAFALAAGYLPINKSSANNEAVKNMVSSNGTYKVSMDQLSDTWAYYHFSEMGTMDQYFWSALDEIEKDVSSPKVALNDAAEGLKDEIGQ